jgi:hypothetical protein
MRRSVLCSIALVALAGCGGSGSGDNAQVSAAAQSYVAAFAAHDAGATCLAMTERSRAQVAEFAQRHMHMQGATCAKAVALLPAAGDGATVESVEVHGARATAAVDGFDRPLTLVREKGTWRVQSSPAGETD